MTNLEHVVLLTLAILGIPAILAAFSIVLGDIEGLFGLYSGWELVAGVVTAALILANCFWIATLI